MPQTQYAHLLLLITINIWSTKAINLIFTYFS